MKITVNRKYTYWDYDIWYFPLYALVNLLEALCILFTLGFMSFNLVSNYINWYYERSLKKSLDREHKT